MPGEISEKKQLVQNNDVEAAQYSNATFDVTVEQLQEIVRQRNMDEFTKNFGSTQGLIEKLHTNTVNGLSFSEIEERRRLFGKNYIEPPPPTPFWKLMLDALNDTTMIILIVSAVVSLILTTTVVDPAELEWIDSVAILVAVVVVVMVSSCNDYSKEKQFRALNAKKDDKLIDVIRDGKSMQVSTHDIVVGDIVELSVGS